MSNEITDDSSGLSAEERLARSSSFGEIASQYERFRPGPPQEAVDWILPPGAKKVVDLGAGTGALSRVLISKVADLFAIEPDDRMRAVLAQEVPAVTTLSGRGESMPLPDASVDAVVASSSWHWMEPVSALNEVARVLVPGGVLGALWSGPDPDGAFAVQAQTMMQQVSLGSEGAGADDDLGALVTREGSRSADQSLKIPFGLPFDQPELKIFAWKVALNADELVGLLGTFSWIILLSDERKERIFTEARRLLKEVLGVEGDVTIDVDFRCEAWKTRRTD
jgi:SAM-dependent methyltransferase